MNSQAVIYVRYSPRPDDLCESLEFQEQFCRHYLAFTGVEVGCVIRDPETSARKVPLIKRKGGRELMALTTGRHPEYRVVVAYRLDRLWRDVVDGNLALRSWRKAGVECHFAAEGGQSINTSTATGRFLVNILLSKSQYEPDLTSERTSAAMQRHIQNGRSMSKNPQYGKQVGPLIDVGGGHMRASLIDNPHEQQVIADILALHAAGVSVRQIACDLIARGVQARTGTWNHVQVHRVLKRAKRTQAIL